MSTRNNYDILKAFLEGSVSLGGNFAVIVKIGGSENPNNLMALKLAYPNGCGHFFTSLQAAEDYIAHPPDTEVDLKRSGGIIMRRNEVTV